MVGVLGRERQLRPALDVFRRLLQRVDAGVDAYVVRPAPFASPPSSRSPLHCLQAALLPPIRLPGCERSQCAKEDVIVTNALSGPLCVGKSEGWS
jgi:hypothetical protein